MGPQKLLAYMAVIYYDVVPLGALLEFNVPALVPVEGTVSILDLASESGVSEDELTRFIRYATANFIFCEPSPGVIGHTAASAALARDPSFCNFLRWLTLDLAAVQASLPITTRKWPQGEQMNESAVIYASGMNSNFWERMNKDPWRQSRFHQAIAEFASGGAAYFSRVLALACPDFTITVQDHTVDFSASAAGTGAYFLRHILHDWPRAEAVSIFRSLLPAFKPGARVLVSEHLMSGGERGESLLEDKKSYIFEAVWEADSQFPNRLREAIKIAYLHNVL
ncbi:uncharacterized protein F4807DRAFT_456664 [Annulohypoxylon truncatum]|uniref:uncharacterized protein n=1 Tax=Annulohypoxylon truncatum TaxID=327061 RepID=UPI002007FF58|nr:uncharacterized protein F4807DRAFT_456664 [Annulohypoxylon truncatum]KAI1213322.1 hypothetical protein F4807DRAFT_456664 [Annulohypoxylon truncatum]